MINLLNKKTQIEKELDVKVKVFGKDYDVKVEYKKIANPELSLCKQSIIMSIPNKYKKSNENIEILKLALEKMYDEIARIEIENVMEETRVMLKGLAPENYVIKRIPGKFSKTLRNGTLIINPDVVKYDKQVLRYVVLYEFCHLKYRTNSKKFWNMLEQYMPRYEEYEYLTAVA